jgi:uncharacterized membrane protein YidH (DUF202 family)
VKDKTMKIKSILQSLGLTLCLCGLLWIVFYPNCQYTITQQEIGGTTYTITTPKLDMPYAIALIIIGVILTIIGSLCESVKVEVVKQA